MDILLSIPVAYRWATTIAFIVVIVGLSVTPGIERADSNLFSWLYANTSTPIQKAMHVAAYAVLAILWMWTLAGVESIYVRSALSLVLALSIGIALEWYQTTVPGRFGSISDVFLNAAGVLFGLIAAILLL